MSSSDAATTKNIYWQELDILRAIAALMMILNHAGYEILQKDLLLEGWSKELIFLGSFAPVFFFFITGVGFGLQFQSNKKDYWISIFYKVFILILADQFLFWNNGEWLGLDFLGFIGLATLIMALLRRSSKSILYSIVGFMLFSGLRYALGPIVNSLGYNDSLLGFLSGTTSIKGVVYPVSPWLAYPFLGFFIGTIILKFLPIINRKFWLIIQILGLISIFFAGCGLFLQNLGEYFYRWGTVSIGFYIVSFMVIAWGLICALIIVRSQSKNSFLLRIFSLKGISSLAIVPIHYFLIYLLMLVNCVNLNLLYFLIIYGGLVVVSFSLADFVNSLSQKLVKSPHQFTLRFLLLFTLTLSISLTIPSHLRTEQDLLLNIFVFLGQIILCLLLPFKWWKSKDLRLNPSQNKITPMSL